MPKSSLTMSLVLFAVLLVFPCWCQARDFRKRSFASLGCMGVYDKAKFARLDRICEECFQLYREPEVHTLCRSNCFKNDYFTRCVSSLLLQKEQQRLDDMVEDLYGKRK